MLTFLIFLLPILLSGILLIRKASALNRLELILPAGSILGLTVFTFLLNFLAFLLKGQSGVVVAYIATAILGPLSYKFIKSEEKIKPLRGKEFLFWSLSVLFFGIFLFWKASHALVGSDTNLYYAVAHSFIRGNFPPSTPWQPDLPLLYHLGAFELLGAFYFLTGLNFQFLHLFFSAFFILCASQAVVWMWIRHKSISTFLFANLVSLAAFISFGSFYLVLPNFPISLPHIVSFNQLIIFLRNLPIVNQAIEVYGAPVDLDGLIYFIFHGFGIAIFLSTVVIMLEFKKSTFITWSLLAINLVTLAFVDESIFIAAAPVIALGIILIEKRRRTLRKNFLPLIFLAIFIAILSLLPGGIFFSALLPPKGIEKSILIVPPQKAIKEKFNDYHYHQETSKILPIKKEWFSLQWVHLGVDVLLILSLLFLVKLRTNFRQFILITTFFTFALTSLIAYNVVIPRFLAANGNRLLIFSFLFFSLVIGFSLIQLLEIIKKNRSLKILLFLFIFWLFTPTIIPPLAFLSKTRFGENLLQPKLQRSSEGVNWIKNNLPFSSRVMVLDVRSPHPSGVARVMVEAGVFSPIFPPDFRAYTIEASPEYLDIAYYLSPKALTKLGVAYLTMDSHFFETLSDQRKKQLEDKKYFTELFFKVYPDLSWQKVFQIQKAYPESGGELAGTIDELTENISGGKIYIDNEENFNPSFLRRALIFSLRDKDLYFLPQSGVYLNVEANINQKNPSFDINYDYLLLGPNTNPETICKCKTENIFKGLKNSVYLWRSE